MRIGIPKGDIRYERFFINNPDKSEIDIEFTNVVFTVKKFPKDESFFFQKSLEQETIEKVGFGDYIVKIQSEDTSNMSYGKYIFLFQLYLGKVLKETFIGAFDVIPGTDPNMEE